MDSDDGMWDVKLNLSKTANKRVKTEETLSRNKSESYQKSISQKCYINLTLKTLNAVYKEQQHSIHKPQNCRRQNSNQNSRSKCQH